VLNEI